MKLVGFRTAKPKQFNYRPLFYNKESEDFEQKIKDTLLREESGSEDLRLREKMRKNWKMKEKSARKRQGMRNLLIAIFLIVLILYFIFLA